MPGTRFLFFVRPHALYYIPVPGYIYMYRYIGRVSVVQHVSQCVSYARQSEYRCLFVFVLLLRFPRLAIESGPFCAGRTLTPHGGYDPVNIAHTWYMVRHSRGSYMPWYYTRCCLWKLPYQKTKHNSWDAVIHVREKSASKAVLSRMQLTLYATRPTSHGASRLMQSMSAWSGKTRRAPSLYCSDARVYDMTIRLRSCMMSSTPPPPSVPTL